MERRLQTHGQVQYVPYSADNAVDTEKIKDGQCSVSARQVPVVVTGSVVKDRHAEQATAPPILGHAYNLSAQLDAPDATVADLCIEVSVYRPKIPRPEHCQITRREV